MTKHNSTRALAGIMVAAIGLTVGLGASATGETAQRETRAGALSKAETKAVKKIAAKIAARQVKKLAPTLSVASAKTADTATSAQTANTANSANTANMANMATTAQTAVNAATVGGIDVKKINAVIPADGASVQLISAEGFTLTASCVAGVVDLVAASSVPGGRLRSADIDNNEAVGTEGTNSLSASGFSIRTPGGDGRGSLTMEFVSASGKVVNAWIGYRNDAPGCAYFGNYMVG